MLPELGGWGVSREVSTVVDESSCCNSRRRVRKNLFFIVHLVFDPSKAARSEPAIGADAVRSRLPLEQARRPMAMFCRCLYTVVHDYAERRMLGSRELGPTGRFAIARARRYNNRPEITYSKRLYQIGRA